MVAASKIQEDYTDNDNKTEAQINGNNVEDWDDRTLCGYADALRPSRNSFFRSEMSQYLLGPLDIRLISRIIHHNNIHHYGNTPEQCGRLVVIMQSRKMYNENHDPGSMLGEILNAVQTLEVVEILHPSTPCCRRTMRTAEDDHRFENRYSLT